MSTTPSPLAIPAVELDLLPWLRQFVDLEIPESGSLEYKRGTVLHKSHRDKPGEKEEMGKDVSAMANANGGLLIYGIDEASGHGERKSPAGFSPVTEDGVTREMLCQIFARNVRPPLENLKIEKVEMPEGGRCFIVEVPKSITAHQSRDNKYWRRRALTTDSMEHYEIVEVMNRQVWPEISLTVMCGRSAQGMSTFSLKILNSGGTICQIAWVQVVCPGWLWNHPVQIDSVPEYGPYITPDGKHAQVVLVDTRVDGPTPPSISRHRRIRLKALFYERGETNLREVPEDILADRIMFRVFADGRPVKEYYADLQEIGPEGGELTLQPVIA